MTATSSIPVAAALLVLGSLTGFSHALWGPAAHVNFGPRPSDIPGGGRPGPPMSSLPTGWSADYGLVFGARVGSSCQYGWSVDHSGAGVYDQTRYRDVADGSIPVQDRTLIIPDRNLEHEGESVWTYETEPGRYRVVLRHSDPQYYTATFGCMLQGSSSSLGLVSAGEPTDFTNENVIVAADGPYANRIYFSGQFVIQNADWDRVSGCNSLSSVSIERWGTFSPTVAPSTSPTGWFEAPGHPENITELQSQTAGLAATVSTLSASVTSLQSSMLEQQTALARLASSVNPAVTTLQADVSRLRAAIANAVAGVPDVVRSNGNGGTAPPSISAEGSDIMVTAGRGGFMVETAACAAFDPCDIVAALNRLREA